MRRGFLAVVLVALFVVVSPPPAEAARATVTITDNAYTPATVRIAPNDDVFWCPQNTTKTHNVDFGNMKSLDIPPGSGCTWLTFQNGGTFSYHCDFVSGMSGTVIVGAGDAVTTTTARVTTTAPHAGTATTTSATRHTTTSATARGTKVTSTTSAEFADAATPTSVTEVVDDATSTTEGQVAIKETAHHGGTSAGNTLAIGASFAMLVGGTGYLLVRRRRLY